MRLRTVDDHIDVIEVDRAFVGNPYLAGHWVSLVASDAVLACHVELEALEDDCAFLGQTAPEELVVAVHASWDELLAVLSWDEGLFELLGSSSSGEVERVVLDCEIQLERGGEFVDEVARCFFSALFPEFSDGVAHWPKSIDP